MKKILVLTDFSENAKHAAKSAMALSENLHADILLYNSFVMAPATPYYAGGPILTEGMMWYSNESKDELKNLAEYLETTCDHCSDGQFKPKITYENGEGNLGNNIAEIIKHKNIELVVMGARLGGTIEHILIGSDTNSVIDHSTRAVLVVPPHSDFKGIKKLIFATDFNEADIKAFDYLVELQKIFYFDIEVVHVSLDNESDLTNFGQEVVFASMINALGEANITYATIRGKDVINRLNRACHESGADVLALVHYKDSFLSRILEASKAKDALAHQKVPLLIIPAKMA